GGDFRHALHQIRNFRARLENMGSPAETAEARASLERLERSLLGSVFPKAEQQARFAQIMERLQNAKSEAEIVAAQNELIALHDACLEGRNQVDRASRPFIQEAIGFVMGQSTIQQHCFALLADAEGRVELLDRFQEAARSLVKDFDGAQFAGKFSRLLEAADKAGLDASPLRTALTEAGQPLDFDQAQKLLAGLAELAGANLAQVESSLWQGAEIHGFTNGLGLDSALFQNLRQGNAALLQKACELRAALAEVKTLGAARVAAEFGALAAELKADPDAGTARGQKFLNDLNQRNGALLDLHGLTRDSFDNLTKAYNELVSLARFNQAGRTRPPDSDALADKIAQAKAVRDALPDGALGRNELSAEIGALERARRSCFDENAVDSLISEANRLNVSSSATQLSEMEDRLGRAYDQLAADGNSRLGPRHKEELLARLAAAKSAVAGHSLQRSLDSLRVVKGAARTLAALEEEVLSRGNEAVNAPLREKISDHSRKQAEEIRKRLSEIEKTATAALAPGADPLTGAAVAAGQLSELRELADSQLRAADKTEVLTAIETLEETVKNQTADKVLAELNKAPALTRGSPNQEIALQFLLKTSLPSQTLVAALKADPAKTGAFLTELGALLGGAKPADSAKVLQALALFDEIMAPHQNLNEAALSLERAAVKETGAELTEDLLKARHEGARLNRQIFAVLKSSAEGRTILAGLGVSSPTELDAGKLEEVLKGLSGSERGPIDLLLAKALFDGDMVANKLSGSDDQLALFHQNRKELLAGLADAPEDLRNLFNLGYSSSKDVASAGALAMKAAGVVSSDKMRQMLERMIQGSEQFAARAAVTGVMRKFLNAKMISYVPSDDNPAGLMRALEKGLTAGLQAPSSPASKARDALRTIAGQADSTVRQSTDVQLAQAVAHFQADLPELDQLSKRLAAETAALKAVQDEIKKLSSPDAQASPAGQRPGDIPEVPKGADEAEKTRIETERQRLLAAPMLFLARQGVVSATGEIKGKIYGEGSGLAVLGFEAIFRGQVKTENGADLSPQDRLKALQGITLPGKYSIEKMNDTVSDPEGEALLKFMKQAQDLDPNDKALAKKLDDLAQKFLAHFDAYGLRDKIVLILQCKDTHPKVNQAFQHANAFERGLGKAFKKTRTPPEGPAIQGQSQAALLQKHLRSELVVFRGALANQKEVLKVGDEIQKAIVAKQGQIIGEAMKSISEKNRDLLRDAAILATFTAFDRLNYDSFRVAAKQLAETRPPQEAKLRQTARDILTKELKLDRDLAELILSQHLDQIVKKAGEKGGAAALASLAQSAAPDSDPVAKAARELSASGRADLEKARMTDTLGQTLESLKPGEGVNLQTSAKISLGVKTEAGPIGLEAALTFAKANGFGVVRDAGGTYQVTVSSGLTLGGGVSVSANALVAEISASVGASGSRAVGAVFTFANRDNCQQFLTDAITGKLSPASAGLCSRMDLIQSHSGGVAATLKVSVGADLVSAAGVKLNGEIAFEAAGRINREVTRSPDRVKTEVVKMGKLAFTAQVAVGLEEEDSGDDNESFLAKLSESVTSGGDAADAARAAAEVSDQLQVGDAVVSVTTENVRAEVTVEREGAGVAVQASVQAVSRSSVTRAGERGDGSVLEATTGVSVNFSGQKSLADFRRFLTARMKVSPETADSLVAHAARRIQDGAPAAFSVTFTHSL
ncbi:MAG: hypothetical protein LBJ64_10205, partial [Deltaproteobacteria bacterium]|nr:hypothetical protein [Deltaproteobacteria bacterium]